MKVELENNYLTDRDVANKVHVYPDGEQYEEPPEWKSDDYEVRETELCEKCDSIIEPHYQEPFATCECGTQEWYK